MKYNPVIVWVIWCILLFGGILLPLAAIVAILTFPKLEGIHVIVILGMAYMIWDVGRTVVTNLPWKPTSK